MASVPISIDTFRSMATRWAPEKVPPGFMINARNCRFVGGDITIRPGLDVAFTGPSALSAINGIGSFALNDGTQVPIAFDNDGNLFKESPEGSGGVQPIAAALAVGQFMDITAAYNRAYMAFSNLRTGQNAPKNYYKYSVDGQFYLDDIGLAPNTAPVASAASTANAGNVAQGTRYCVVLFQTRTGYIGGYDAAATLQIDVAADGFTLQLTGIPLGPSNTVRRIIAFTQSGASAFGPFFYIPLDDDVIGLRTTATVVEGNAATTAEFNFTDEYLVGSIDVTNFADKIPLAPQKAVFYSKTLKRMIWCGEDDNIYRVTEVDDPETVFGTTGFCQPGQGDNGVVMTAREWKTELYLCKSNGGYSVADTTVDPAQWRTPQRWEGSGPCGPWAIDTCDEFLAYAHKSGLYIYTGLAPMWVSFEMTGRKGDFPSWDNINWDYAHLVYVTIDTENKLVRVGAPLGDAVTNSVEFIVDYSEGWKDRRWSYDDSGKTKAVRMTRTLAASPNPNVPIDNRLKQTQMLLASNNPDGLVLMENPASITDNGSGILQLARIAFTPYQKATGIYQLTALDITASGGGEAWLTIYPAGSNPMPLRNPIPLDTVNLDHNRKPRGQNERWSIEVSNNGEAANWFGLQRLVLWINKIWENRTV